MIHFRTLPSFTQNATIICITPDQLKKKNFKRLKNQSVVNALSLLARGKTFVAKTGDIFPLPLDKSTLLCVGVDPDDTSGTSSLRIAIKRALQSPFIKNASTVEIIPHNLQEGTIKDIIEGAVIGGYRWKKYLSKDENIEKEVTVISPLKKTYTDAITISAGVSLARDLVNDNADITTAVYIEKKIRDLIKGVKNISIEVLAAKDLKSKGLNLHYAVSQGSAQEPRLVVVKYSGAQRKKNDIAFVGKGITFDSGGLNLKPSGHMETMRCDMSGAAAVFGTLHNCIQLKIKKNVLFVFGLAENAIGSRAYKPGDVFKGYSGKTVEIGNTDAEGRLVLADAMSYVIKNYSPERMVDIATLTGACMVALGNDYSGLFSNNDILAARLLDSAKRTDDRVWRLPLYPEITKALKSKYADIKSIGYPRGVAGAITAAEFLRQFVDKVAWAHLDIAGPAFVEEQERLYYNYGATGVGVRLFTDYLLHN